MKEEKKQKHVTFAELETEHKEKENKITMPLNTEFDIPTAIETLWLGKKASTHACIAAFESPAAAWSVTDIRG